DDLNLAARRITLSSAGLANMIQRLEDDERQFNVALSLHAADDQKRDDIMLINAENLLLALADALTYFYTKTISPITYEYIVFHDFNDGLADAQELAAFCKHVPCKVNIIEYNPIAYADFVNAAEDKIDRFAAFLRQKGIVTNIRRSRGKDIDAACGQLAIKETASSTL